MRWPLVFKPEPKYKLTTDGFHLHYKASFVLLTDLNSSVNQYLQIRKTKTNLGYTENASPEVALDFYTQRPQV